MVPMLIFLLLASPALGIRLDGSVGAVEVPKKGDKCECPGKNCCGDDSLVCDVKTRTCKPSLGSLCSSNYFFTECASKDTYNVSTECALSAAGYHRCCIKSGQPLFACAVFA
ncbi:unnamed protein product [Cladocopium goreaui]|uniref:Uncharacterized protein n=1 Tax=Cladocopium goreaui TaxID=2562237 RepID=A0A9P1DLA2_9DINO|nr:unnamed protein product [Cladocopium goreaui]